MLARGRSVEVPESVPHTAWRVFRKRYREAPL